MLSSLALTLGIVATSAAGAPTADGFLPPPPLGIPIQGAPTEAGSLSDSPAMMSDASDVYASPVRYGGCSGCDRCGCRGKRKGKRGGCGESGFCNHGWHYYLWHSSCDMPQHMPYFTPAHGNYYFRPYSVAQLADQVEAVRHWGGDPRNPYDNGMFQRIYTEVAAEEVPVAEPELMPDMSP